MPDAIRMEQLTKRYGRKCGLDGLDLTVRSGEGFGFLGPNGAGKTTIRLLLDLLRPTTARHGCSERTRMRAVSRSAGASCGG